MVRIRLKRMGRKHRPFYRLNAVEKKTPRDGKVIEALGWYDPLATDPAKTLSINEDRVRHWLAVGAQPSDTVNDILAKRGLIDAAKWNAVRASRIKRKVEKMNADKAAAAAATEAKPESA
ncbi:MAG TPA: 30S ribosomal protein S16 [Phycisphaerales bacterium]|nr:30S ribosomal protein S16 [Phycisphaerales bacterium]